MYPLVIVEFEIVPQAFDRLRDVFVSVQINFFVFHTAPQSFDEDVVQRASASIHADGNAAFFEFAGLRRERGGWELKHPETVSTISRRPDVAQRRRRTALSRFRE